MFQEFGKIATALLAFNFQALNDVDKINALAAISQTVAALLSLAALLLSLWVFSRQQNLNRWQLRLQREDHIIAWSRMCLSLMAEVEENVKCHVLKGEELLASGEFIHFRSRLSALIDEGRLYFPNIKDPKKGANKDPAYRGHRQKILDDLVAFYDLLDRMQNSPAVSLNEATITNFNQLRRSFVSSTQTTIDPRRFNRIRA